MMEFEKRYQLSFYEKISDLSDHKNVSLVRHTNTGMIYVRKMLTDYNLSIYTFLKDHPMPFYPKIQELVEDDDTLYLIEEYIEGLSLQQYLEQSGCMKPDDAKHTMLMICDAVAYLHQQHPPIIHRDLKPSNIIRRNNGEIVLIDFNVSRFFQPKKEQDTVISGTRGFAAPEQYGNHQSDERTDIYALGVLFHYLLTLDYPASQHYKGGAESIITKCTDYYPEKRYQNIRQLMKDIQKLPELYPENNQLHQHAAPRQGQKKELAKPPHKITSAKKKYPFLPPGFRTVKIWKSILGSIGYFLIIITGCYLKVTSDDGHALTAGEYLANQICYIVICIGLIFFWFNYLNIQSHLPLCKNKNLFIRILGIALFSFIYAFVVMFILVLIMN